MNYFFVGIKSLCKFDINNQYKKIDDNNLGIIDKYLDPLDYKSLKELKNIDINKFYEEHKILKIYFYNSIMSFYSLHISVYNRDDINI